MNVIALETERLLLREPEESDFPQIFEYAQDFEVFRCLEYGPFAENEARALLQTMINYRKENPRTQYELAAVLKDTAQIIGNCGIHISSLPNREGWIDTALNRRYWNRGFASEITLGLLGWGFNELKLHRITATCLSTNASSERVLIKAGLKREGCLRGNKLIRGEWHDSLLYAILENEWKSHN